MPIFNVLPLKLGIFFCLNGHVKLNGTNDAGGRKQAHVSVKEAINGYLPSLIRENICTKLSVPDKKETGTIHVPVLLVMLAIISLFRTYFKRNLDVCLKLAYAMIKGFPKGEYYAKTYETQTLQLPLFLTEILHIKKQMKRRKTWISLIMII